MPVVSISYCTFSRQPSAIAMPYMIDNKCSVVMVDLIFWFFFGSYLSPLAECCIASFFRVSAPPNKLSAHRGELYY